MSAHHVLAGGSCGFMTRQRQGKGPSHQPTMSSGNTAAPSPVRAITSTLSTRAAPPVPPAYQTYEPLARAVLRRRLLYDILPLSILPVWTSAICWKMWNSGRMSASGILNTLAIPIHPSTLLMTTILWVFGVLPLVILRKSQLTGESINNDLCIQSYVLQLFPLPPLLPPNASRSPFPNHTHSVHSHCTFSQAFSFQPLMSYSVASVAIILGFSSNRGTYSPSRDPHWNLSWLPGNIPIVSAGAFYYYSWHKLHWPSVFISGTFCLIAQLFVGGMTRCVPFL
jgi:hypothetical protein